MTNGSSTDTHPDDLLAWYVNGTLEDEERAAVEAHLQSCEQCQDEVEFLHRLRVEVKAAAPTRGPGKLGLKRLQREIRKESRHNSTPPQWWRPAMALAVLVVVVQSGLLLGTWTSQPPIEPLGGMELKGIVLQVEFAPDARLQTINAVLREADATVVDGPSAIGLYRVRLDTDAEDEARIQAIVAKMRTRTEVIVYVSREIR